MGVVGDHPIQLKDFIFIYERGRGHEWAGGGAEGEGLARSLTWSLVSEP